jgi:hypothetical protein
MTLVGMLAQPAATAEPQSAEMHRHASILRAVTVADQTKFVATKAAPRDLWIGHVVWIRNVVVAQPTGDAPPGRRRRSRSSPMHSRLSLLWSGFFRRR